MAICLGLPKYILYTCILTHWFKVTLELLLLLLSHFSRVRLFVTPWTAARQASLSITNSWSLPKLLSIELVMPSNHLILCHPLLLLPSIFPSIRVFSHESVLHIRWPKYWSVSFNINPSSEHSGLISFRMDCITISKPSGGNGIPAELFKILKDAAAKLLHSICQ